MSTLQTRDRSNGERALLTRPFGEFLGWDPMRAFTGGFSPFAGVDVTRTESGYTVEIPVAGFKPDQVEITLEDGILSVNAKNEKRQFTRTITVPDEVDEERIEANVADGMLVLTLNLLPKAQPKKIPVK